MGCGQCRFGSKEIAAMFAARRAMRSAITSMTVVPEVRFAWANPFEPYAVGWQPSSQGGIPAATSSSKGPIMTNLARFSTGRILLHLAAMLGDGCVRFHVAGIIREVAPATFRR
jgi:hypothetical protein